ncbi:MAG: hypothetical protein CM15mP125_4400 [Gammaproteobacteria bacterium]|nr:MAG: hypothetical protein CM15mP125_4400 [Gammaproteobacteria bacterium]
MVQCPQRFHAVGEEVYYRIGAGHITQLAIVVPADGGERCQCFIQSCLLDVADRDIRTGSHKRFRTG